MTALTQGANAAIPSGVVSVSLTWPDGKGVLDASAYLLNAAGRVRGDGDMVFYNQPAGGNGAVAMEPQGAGVVRYRVEPAKLPADVERVVFCLTVESGGTFSAFNGANLVVTGADGAVAASFTPDAAQAREAAMMIAELYLRNDKWKVRAVAQGFNGGLAPLARHFGIAIDDAAIRQVQPSPPSSPPSSPPAPPPARPIPPQPVAPIRLSKITLDKARPTVRLEKAGAQFGPIVVNLNWSAPQKGLFAGRGTDLDLGCLYELRDGTKGVVQALGDTFGSFDKVPFIHLSGDDRSGNVAAGETLRVNGARWGDLRRLALFAFIYDGAPNWAATDGVVTVTVPDQPPVEVRLSDGQDRHGFCGIALIENDNGAMKMTRLVEYMRGHREFDQSVGWGLRWQVASKD